ncbi:hypothetical protein M0R72_10670 [Candidatus Pacearchaeota archaeon]|jgi:NTP pyrophosphatase (non-canonical NTP hydrolase)|nr:hypothetical protein [Candidatus Pacearchaeota archaeon]
MASELFELVRSLHLDNAKHVRRKRRLCDYSVAQCTNHLLEEAVEVQAEILASGIPYVHRCSSWSAEKLSNKNQIVEEMGDALAVMYHLMIRLELSLESVEERAVLKLRETFV